MNDLPALALALLSGTMLGAFFFVGLWWTVQKGLASKTPALWFLGSLVLRTSVTLAGFYVVSQGHWSRLGTCLLGFVIARVVVAKWLARAPVGQAFQPDSSKGVRLENLTYDKETSHAPKPR